VKAAPRSLKARALQWLAQREHSRDELRRKLLPHARALAALGEGSEAGASDASEDNPIARVDTLLDWLEANRYLSQQRFAESRVHVRAPRYGNLRIRQELAQHGVALDAATSATLAGSEFERAREVWARKFAETGAADDAAGRARQARFLTSRGFTPEVMRRVLREACRRPADD